MEQDFLGFVWESIVNRFFYDLKSSIVSIIFLIGVYYFFKLLKYDNEKPGKSLTYVASVLVSFVTAFLIASAA